MVSKDKFMKADKLLSEAIATLKESLTAKDKKRDALIAEVRVKINQAHSLNSDFYVDNFRAERQERRVPVVAIDAVNGQCNQIVELIGKGFKR